MIGELRNLQQRLTATVRARYPLLQVSVYTDVSGSVVHQHPQDKLILLKFQAKREPDVDVWVKVPYKLLYTTTDTALQEQIITEHVLMAIYDRLDDEDKEDD